MNMKRSLTCGVRQRSATMCSPPVISEVSPNSSVLPVSYSLSKALPTVGLAPQPEVVSLSPHLVETHSSSMAHGWRCLSLAHCTNSRAARLARRMVSWSPWPSMPKPSAGLPVLVMPSTTLRVQLSSMPMTTTAATLGLQAAVGVGNGERALDVVRNGLGGGVGQVIERQDHDMVAHADAAVLAAVAEERGLFGNDGHGGDFFVVRATEAPARAHCIAESFVNAQAERRQYGVRQATPTKCTDVSGMRNGITSAWS